MLFGDAGSKPAGPQGQSAHIKDGSDATFMADVIEASQATPVIVDFWATWCGPCKEEMPSLAKLAKDYADRGVKVVPISVDRLEDGGAAKDFLRTHGGLPFYNDPEYRVVFGLTPRPDGIPTTVIYDKAGKEQARLSGGADWSTDQAKKVMDAVLARG